MSLRNFAMSCLLVALAAGCRTPVQEQDAPAEDPYKEPLEEVNRYMLERNRERILAFITRAGWAMQETPTGLWYEILDPGKGQRVVEDHLVTYTYETRLLDGTFCYAADTTAPKKIVLGKGNIETGLQEGLLMLREGAEARFIIPPYLAHGNFGDGDKIPGSAILLVEVHVLSVKR